MRRRRTDDVFVAFTVAAFLKFVAFFMLEIRYLLRIWVASRPTAANPDALRRELAILFALFCAYSLSWRAQTAGRSLCLHNAFSELQTGRW